MEHELPMLPSTMIRNALGKQFGGSGACVRACQSSLKTRKGSICCFSAAVIVGQSVGPSSDPLCDCRPVVPDYLIHDKPPTPYYE